MSDEDLRQPDTRLTVTAINSSQTMAIGHAQQQEEDPRDAEIADLRRQLEESQRSVYTWKTMCEEYRGTVEADNRDWDKMVTDLTASREQVKRLQDALHWIATVNESIDMRKLDTKTLMGLIHELRGKAKGISGREGQSTGSNNQPPLGRNT